jgi:hypothetical protein
MDQSIEKNYLETIVQNAKVMNGTEDDHRLKQILLSSCGKAKVAFGKLNGWKSTRAKNGFTVAELAARFGFLVSNNYRGIHNQIPRAKYFDRSHFFDLDLRPVAIVGQPRCLESDFQSCVCAAY